MQPLTDIHLEQQQPSYDDVLAQLAGQQRVNPFVPVDQTRVRWETIFIVVFTIAIAIVGSSVLLHMGRAAAHPAAVAPRHVVAAAPDATPSMTKTEAQSIVSQARTAMLAGQFDAAATLLDRVGGVLSDETGASELRDENARRQTQANDATALVQASLTSGNWPQVHAALTSLSKVLPLTPEQQALDTRALRETRIGSEVATIRKLLDTGDAPSALVRARRDALRFKDPRFTSLAAEAKAQVDAAVVKVTPAPKAKTTSNAAPPGTVNPIEGRDGSSIKMDINNTASALTATGSESPITGGQSQVSGGGPTTNPNVGISQDWLNQMAVAG